MNSGLEESAYELDGNLEQKHDAVCIDPGS